MKSHGQRVGTALSVRYRT